MMSSDGDPVSTQNTNISWVWWCVPVVPATREAECDYLFYFLKQRGALKFSLLEAEVAVSQDCATMFQPG